MIGSSKQQLDKFGARVVKLARINLGARQKIDGKMRVTNNTGELSLNSPFKFKSKNLPKGVMAGWIKSKPIRLREMGTGKFSKNTDQAKKQLAFVLGRSVATKGMSARHYFKDAVEQALPNDGGDIAVSIALNYIKKNLRS